MRVRRLSGFKVLFAMLQLLKRERLRCARFCARAGSGGRTMDSSGGG